MAVSAGMLNVLCRLFEKVVVKTVLVVDIKYQVIETDMILGFVTVTTPTPLHYKDSTAPVTAMLL